MGGFFTKTASDDIRIASMGLICTLFFGIISTINEASLNEVDNKIIDLLSTEHKDLILDKSSKKEYDTIINSYKAKNRVLPKMRKILLYIIILFALVFVIHMSFFQKLIKLHFNLIVISLLLLVIILISIVIYLI